jgi:hypothetical protein
MLLQISARDIGQLTDIEPSDVHRIKANDPGVAGAQEHL